MGVCMAVIVITNECTNTKKHSLCFYLSKISKNHPHQATLFVILLAAYNIFYVSCLTQWHRNSGRGGTTWRRVIKKEHQFSSPKQKTTTTKLPCEKTVIQQTFVMFLWTWPGSHNFFTGPSKLLMPSVKPHNTSNQTIIWNWMRHLHSINKGSC